MEARPASSPFTPTCITTLKSPSHPASKPEGKTSYHLVLREEKLAVGSLLPPMSQDQVCLSLAQPGCLLTMQSSGFLRALRRDCPGQGVPQGGVPGEGLLQEWGFRPPGSLSTRVLTAAAVQLYLRAGRKEGRKGEYVSEEPCNSPATPTLCSAHHCGQQTTGFWAKRSGLVTSVLSTSLRLCYELSSVPYNSY